MIMNSMTIAVLIAFISIGCGTRAGNPGEEGPQKHDNESAAIFAEHGENSLGIETNDYDYAIVYENSSNLLLADTSESHVSVAQGNDGIANATDAELELCNESGETIFTDIIIDTNKSHTEVEPAENLAIKLVSNNASIDLLITGTDAESAPIVRNLCIIVSGNKGEVNVVIDNTQLENVTYVSQGNKSTAAFEVKNDASLGAFASSLNGNKNSISVIGAGEYVCEEIKIEGNRGSKSCADHTE